jgi:hypothetical protein
MILDYKRRVLRREEFGTKFLLFSMARKRRNCRVAFFLEVHFANTFLERLFETR